MRGDDLNHQPVFGDVDLVNQHRFWQVEQGRPFHHNLPFQAQQPVFRILLEETIS